MNIFGEINRDEDMRKLLLLIALPVFLGLASCEKEVLKILPQKIELVGAQDLVFGYGTTEKVEFMVSPPDAQFNYDLSSEDCEVKLELRGTPPGAQECFSGRRTISG